MFWYLIVVLVLMIPLLAIVLDSQLGRALAQRLERNQITSGDEVMAERVAFLEGEVERLNHEVERLHEESDFLHRLLTDRSEGSGPDDAPPPLPEAEGQSRE